MGHYASELPGNGRSEHLGPKKARTVSSRSIKTIIKSIPLETRLYVVNDMLILNYLVDTGVIPDGGWTDEKEEKYGKELHKFAKRLAKAQLKEMKDWEKDGRPK